VEVVVAVEDMADTMEAHEGLLVEAVAVVEVVVERLLF
jgi:hypothetical protein